MGHNRITAIEFGVAGGSGLLVPEGHAERVVREIGIKIDIVGFDLGSGLPELKD
ncbi:MAG: hypothetical protein ACR2RF_01345 [Geminicoccaceae bacterium]